MARADFDAQLVFVPNAIWHNLPDNENVIASWGKKWPDLPESPLLVEIWHHLRTALQTGRPGLVAKFEQACPLPARTGSDIPSEYSPREVPGTPPIPFPEPRRMGLRKGCRRAHRPQRAVSS